MPSLPMRGLFPSCKQRRHKDLSDASPKGRVLRRNAVKNTFVMFRWCAFPSSADWREEAVVPADAEG